jgi:hypothetical protein
MTQNRLLKILKPKTAIASAKLRHDLLMGVLSATLAFGILAVMNALLKKTSTAAPIEVIVLLQNLIGLVVTAPIALRNGWAISGRILLVSIS